MNSSSSNIEAPRRDYVNLNRTEEYKNPRFYVDEQIGWTLKPNSASDKIRANENSTDL